MRSEDASALMSEPRMQEEDKTKRWVGIHALESLGCTLSCLSYTLGYVKLLKSFRLGKRHSMACGASKAEACTRKITQIRGK